MLTLNNLLIIGAAGRNAGKTEFACNLIQKFASSKKIIALKVTTVNEANGKCPRGGEGCGVCSSLKGRYDLTEETQGPAEKDTVRMLNAGAHKVYWLRVLKDHLEEGFKSFLTKLSGDEMIICESNSLRLAVKPGVFVIMRGKGSQTVKPSCKEVWKYADYINDYHQNHYEISAKRFVFVNKHWNVLEPASAIILSGGKSSRMGTDKSLLEIDKKPIIKQITNKLELLFDDIYISANAPEKYQFLKKTIIPDIEKDKGPMLGIKSSLLQTKTDLNFFVTCDVPDINPGLIENLLLSSRGYDAIIPRAPSGKIEPLFAVYRKSILPEIEKMLKNGILKIRAIYDHIRTNYYDLPLGEEISNLNNREDFQNYLNQTKKDKVC